MTAGKNIKYFSISPTDEAWGTVVTTIGYQPIPRGSSYPRSQHPESHVFEPSKGRILNEYQLIYIAEGSGSFRSASCRRRRVRAGMLILLFPGEWHTYEPDPDSGWFEYWVGFRGAEIDRRVAAGFFSPGRPLCDIGFRSEIVSLYEDIANYAMEEKSSYQQIISGMVLYLLGKVYFMQRNAALNDSYVLGKINEAKAIMKRGEGCRLSPESIADSLGVSYSWFRKMFRRYAAMSPAQYMADLRMHKAKKLLEDTDLSVTEIAYRLGFETARHFSTCFRSRNGRTPLQYRTLFRDKKQ